MSKLDDLIRAAKQELSEPKTVTVPVAVGGEPVEFVFTKLEPMEWRNLCAKFPPRSESPRDMMTGYNSDLAPSGYPVAFIAMVDGDERVPVSADEWAGVFSVLESPDIHNVAVALWGMHDFEAQEKVKKAFGAAKKK